MPMTASDPPGSRRPSHRLISCMHGQTGRSRLARASASPMWSKWPWVTSSTSQRSIESAVRGLRGLPNHGSSRMTLSPGVRISKQECPYQVNVVSRSSAPRPPPGRCLFAATLDAVPATQIAQNLAFVNWTLLTGLALGTYAAVVLLAGGPRRPADIFASRRSARSSSGCWPGSRTGRCPRRWSTPRWSSTRPGTARAARRCCVHVLVAAGLVVGRLARGAPERRRWAPSAPRWPRSCSGARVG